MTTFNIGFVIFPNLTQLDFTGPLEVLHRLPESKIHIVAKSLDPVSSDCGLSLLPTTTFKDCSVGSYLRSGRRWCRRHHDRS
jgi:cyclohexyl-isocyanide hydratase